MRKPRAGYVRAMTVASATSNDLTLEEAWETLSNMHLVTVNNRYRAALAYAILLMEAFLYSDTQQEAHHARGGAGI